MLDTRSVAGPTCVLRVSSKPPVLSERNELGVKVWLRFPLRLLDRKNLTYSPVFTGADRVQRRFKDCGHSFLTCYVTNVVFICAPFVLNPPRSRDHRECYALQKYGDVVDFSFLTVRFGVFCFVSVCNWTDVATLQ